MAGEKQKDDSSISQSHAKEVTPIGFSGEGYDYLTEGPEGPVPDPDHPQVFRAGNKPSRIHDAQNPEAEKGETE